MLGRSGLDALKSTARRWDKGDGFVANHVAGPDTLKRLRGFVTDVWQGENTKHWLGDVSTDGIQAEYLGFLKDEILRLHGLLRENGTL